MRTAALGTLVAALVSACGVSHHVRLSQSAGAITGPVVATYPAKPADGGVFKTATPAAVAREFAVSYGRFLDGTIPPVAVAAASATVRGQLGAPLPTRHRSGTLTLAQLEPARASSFRVVLRDRSRSYPFTVTVGRQSYRWLVISWNPPDIDESLHGTAPPAPQPTGAAAPLAAASAFVNRYVLLLCGETTLGQVLGMTAALRSELEHNFHVPLSERGLHARILDVHMKRAGSGWQAWALVNDGRTQYGIVVTLVKRRRRWLAANVELS